MVVRKWPLRSNLETKGPSHPASFSCWLFKPLDRLPLWLLVLLSLSGYVLLAFWFPLKPFYKRVPLSDLRSLSPSLLEGFIYGCLVCLLFGLMALAFRRVRESARPPALLKIVGVSALFALPLLLTYPFNANDIYRYVIRGRIFSSYGESPFSAAPEAFPDDPFLPLAGEWAGATSPYGPLWEITASSMTRLSDDSLLLGLLSFKVLALIAFAGSAVLLWKMLVTPAAGDASNEVGRPAMSNASRAAYTILWAWNPALLLIFVANGHNDALMIFWLLLGFFFIHRGHPEAGFVLMFLGPLTKPIGVLALPLFFVAIWRELASNKLRMRFLLVSVGGGLLLIALSFLPIGSPSALVQRLMQEAAGGAGFSPAVLLILMAQKQGLSLPLDMVSRATLLLFGLFVLWLLWKTWRGRSPVRGTADIFYGYFLQALSFRIWYAAWPFPWLLLDAAADPGDGRVSFRLRYGLWFLLTTQLSALIYGHIRLYRLGGEQLPAHYWGVLFTFSGPFVLAWLSGYDGPFKKRRG
jgi:hypothetical protein